MRYAKRLPKPFIGSKYKSPILPERPAYGAAKLITVKWRFWAIKEVPSIEGAVSDKFKRTAMKMITSRPGRRCNDSSGRATILRWIIGGDHRQLLDCIYA